MNLPSIRKIALYISVLYMVATNSAAAKDMQIFDHISFYDGYLVANIPDDINDPEGVDRLYTYLITTKLSDEQLAQIGQHLDLEVRIHPVCDNYDRIGSVNLAFIPKGQNHYKVDYNDKTDPMRIEIARFITPFLDKNQDIQSVPYSYTIDNLSRVLRDKSLREQFDIWVELEVFGVPYAAQSQISGCKGCNEVFQGSLWFTTDDEPAPMVDTDVFVPIVTRRSDWRGDRGMNNYNEACTDILGETVKTFNFYVPQDVKSGRVVIMMSNHGAGSNGEEYVRRMHFAFFDNPDEPITSWLPGRTTCEFYRIYNTQANGIYGNKAMTPNRWQAFSNWCPGAPIPYQTFETGPISAGNHFVKIAVPDAQFYGSDGYFPVSIYFQGDTEQEVVVDEPYDHGALSSVPSICTDDYFTSIRSLGSTLDVDSPDPITAVQFFDLQGRHILTQAFDAPQTHASVDTSSLTPDTYIIVVHSTLRSEAHKFHI